MVLILGNSQNQAFLNFRAQVTLSDLPETLPLLRLNINENKTKISSMGGYAIAESLIWGDNTSEILKEEFDMVVLADCVYYEEVIYFILCIT